MHELTRLLFNTTLLCPSPQIEAMRHDMEAAYKGELQLAVQARNGGGLCNLLCCCWPRSKVSCNSNNRQRFVYAAGQPWPCIHTYAT